MKKLAVLILLIFTFTLSGCASLWEEIVETASEYESEAAAQAYTDDLNSIDRLDLNFGLGEDENEYFIMSDEAFDDDLCWVSVYAGEKGTTYKFKQTYDGDTDVTELVRWMSTNEDVVEVSTRKASQNSYIYVDIELVGEGVAEVYAETVDQRVRSESIKFVYGNKHNVEYTVTSHIGRYVLSKVKYPTKTTTVIDYTRDPWLFNFKNRRVYVYGSHTDNSYTNVESVEVSGTNVTAKGYVDSFLSTGMNVKCNFIIEMTYNEDFTEYTITSEKYDIPEIIREKLE